MKLIDREKLLEKIREQKNDLTRYCGCYTYLMRDEQINYDQLERIEEMIADEPVVEDAVPVKFGYWRNFGHCVSYKPMEIAVCSVCGAHSPVGDYAVDRPAINYCPCCGAKMKQEKMIRNK